MEDIPSQLSLVEGTLVFQGSITMVGLAILIWMVSRILLRTPDLDESDD